jgi:hypothetical protein
MTLCCTPQFPDGDAVPRIEQLGDHVLITVQRGSLSSERPSDDAGRVEALASYLRENRELFGLPAVQAEALTFVEAAPQDQISNDAGETYTLLAVYQTHQNAAVIDEFLMAAFLAGEDGDELRRVRGRLHDPGELPVPPDPAVVSRDRVAPAVQELIEQYGLSADFTTVSESPVISAAYAVAGYLVSQFVSTETGSFDRFRAVVDPRDLRVVVLDRQPPCDAAQLPPPDVDVMQIPSPGSIPPGFENLRIIGIQAVQLSDSDGSNLAPMTRQEVRLWVDEANKVWTPQAGILFSFDDSAGSDDFETWGATLLNTVPADDAEDAKYNAAGSVWALLFHPDRVVVFFRARGGGGWSWGPTTTFFVSMPYYTNTSINKPDDGGYVRNDTLLSHELGHYFGLGHPFPGLKFCSDATPANSDADVNGQNPNTTADDVHDTNADFTDACVPTNSLTCPGGSLSYNGHIWNPPWNNVMSYHDCLPEELTTDQVNVINVTLQHPTRANLLP